MRKLATALFVYALAVSTTPSLANEIRFIDYTGYDILNVVKINERYKETKPTMDGPDFVIPLAEYVPGEEISFPLQLYSPDPKGSSDIAVEDFPKLEHNVVLVVPKNLEKEIVVPVFYPHGIGRKELRAIARVDTSHPRGAFEQYFRAALLAEYYETALNGKSTRDYRKAVMLWLAGGKAISRFHSDWFRIPTSIVHHSEVVFGSTSKEHKDLIKELKLINHPSSAQK